MGIMRIILVCISIALCMESAYAMYEGSRCRREYSRALGRMTWYCQVNWHYTAGKRSVYRPEAEAKDREMMDYMQNNATIADYIWAGDDNRDGCLDAAEWINHDGRVPDFCTLLDSYDANDDDCLRVEELNLVPVTMEVEWFMNVPMDKFDDMMKKIDGMEDEEGMEDDEGTEGKGRKTSE